MKGKFGSGALLVAGPHQRTGVRVFQAEPLKKRRGGGRWAAKSVTLGALLRFHIIVVGRSSHPSRGPFLLLMRSAGNARPTFCLSLPLIIPLTSGSKELTKKPLYSVCVCFDIMATAAVAAAGAMVIVIEISAGGLASNYNSSAKWSFDTNCVPNKTILMYGLHEFDIGVSFLPFFGGPHLTPTDRVNRRMAAAGVSIANVEKK